MVNTRSKPKKNSKVRVLDNKVKKNPVKQPKKNPVKQTKKKAAEEKVEAGPSVKDSSGGDSASNEVQIVDKGVDSDQVSKRLKDEVLALRIQDEEKQKEIDRLRALTGGSDTDKLKAAEADIEARVEARVKKSLLEDLQDSEERQAILLNRASRKFDKPFKGNFKFKGDERFYNYTQDILSLLEETLYQLQSVLPESSKAWEPFKAVCGKVRSVEEDIVTAQVSPHGWALIDRFNDSQTGFKFIDDPEKAKALKELEKELTKEKKNNGPPNKKFFPRQGSSLYDSKRKRSFSSSPHRSSGGRRYRSRSRSAGRRSPDRRRSSPRREDSGKSFGEKKGACAWCGDSSHFYRHCTRFQQDVRDKKAHYNLETKRWELKLSDGSVGKHSGFRR